MNPILSVIINQSLYTGIFPDKLKTALVKPLHKKEQNNIFQNYRPISLLPAISKVFEKVVYKQVYDYFKRHKLLYGSQYGFREGHSTEHASLELTDRIFLDLDRGDMPITIYLDFSKAFDMIDHSILIEKLYKYGFSGNCLQWFKSYLSNRTQCVQYLDCVSSPLPISKGVPQGSVLGPLLFIIFINDIHKCSDIFEFILYADDTTITSPLASFIKNHTSTDTINIELNKLYHWIQINNITGFK